MVAALSRQPRSLTSLTSPRRTLSALAPGALRLLRPGAAAAAAAAEVHPRHRTHDFYIAPASPYGPVVALLLYSLLQGLVLLFHKASPAVDLRLILVATLAGVFLWMKELNEQGSYLATYTPVAQKNLLLGIVLFIVSEVMIFFGVFWGYFHSSLNPSVELGAIWPPKNLEVLEWWKWPALGTLLLVYSGFAVNVFYYALKGYNGLGQRLLASAPSAATAAEAGPLGQPFFGAGAGASGGWSYIYGGLLQTLAFGLAFLLCQKYEYSHAAYDISDGVYGTIFYGLTGLHGLHVFLGFSMLLLALVRLGRHFFAFTSPHVAVTGTVWYWHFVDIVWLVVFAVVYYWGSSTAAATALAGGH